MRKRQAQLKKDFEEERMKGATFSPKTNKNGHNEVLFNIKT